MKVYPPRDIRPFVMYCVNGKPRSSLLIESTDSMINSDKCGIVAEIHCAKYGCLARVAESINLQLIDRARLTQDPNACAQDIFTAWMHIAL